MSIKQLKANIYTVQKGKLIPRSSTIQQKKIYKNYRYIPYDPLNNPDPEDYFRQTISRLEKQNYSLKKQLNSFFQHSVTNTNSNQSQGIQLQQVKKYQSQIKILKEELSTRDRCLIQKTEQLRVKQKQILQISNQNSRLHIQTKIILREVQSLNNLMLKKDQDIYIKKQQIENYCKGIQQIKLIKQKQKQQEYTNFTDNLIITPRMLDKCYQDNQYLSNDNYSLKDRCESDKKYHKEDLKINIDHLHHLVQKQQKQYNFRSARNLKTLNKDVQKNNKCVQIYDNFQKNEHHLVIGYGNGGGNQKLGLGRIQQGKHNGKIHGIFNHGNSKLNHCK